MSKRSILLIAAAALVVVAGVLASRARAVPKSVASTLPDVGPF